ncbi:type II toxin-antitoxin system ParD family antitoxin [Neorhizobium sp. LMR1-1-1.1]|jgi:antitoxin ParD1/3/4
MNKPVQVTVSDQAASFVSRELESGRFDTVDEVIEAGLRMLEEEQMKIERLRELLIESENSRPAHYVDRDEFLSRMREKHGQ